MTLESIVSHWQAVIASEQELIRLRAEYAAAITSLIDGAGPNFEVKSEMNEDPNGVAVHFRNGTMSSYMLDLETTSQPILRSKTPVPADLLGHLETRLQLKAKRRKGPGNTYAFVPPNEENQSKTRSVPTSTSTPISTSVPRVAKPLTPKNSSAVRMPSATIEEVLSGIKRSGLAYVSTPYTIADEKTGYTHVVSASDGKLVITPTTHILRPSSSLIHLISTNLSLNPQKGYGRNNSYTFTSLNAGEKLADISKPYDYGQNRRRLISSMLDLVRDALAPQQYIKQLRKGVECLTGTVIDGDSQYGVVFRFKPSKRELYLVRKDGDGQHTINPQILSQMAVAFSQQYEPSTDGSGRSWILKRNTLEESVVTPGATPAATPAVATSYTLPVTTIKTVSHLPVSPVVTSSPSTVPRPAWSGAKPARSIETVTKPSYQPPPLRRNSEPVRVIYARLLEGAANISVLSAEDGIARCQYNSDGQVINFSLYRNDMGFRIAKIEDASVREMVAKVIDESHMKATARRSPYSDTWIYNRRSQDSGVIADAYIHEVGAKIYGKRRNK